jgi:HK97 gp10 family phage protein
MSDINKQVNDLIKRFKKEEKQIKKDLHKIVMANAFEGASIAKRKAPKAFSKLAQSIGIEKDGELKANVVVNMDYAPYVEFGTGGKVDVPQEWSKLASELKGKGGGGFSKALQSIKDWCRLKGIDEKAAYPILMTILEQGQRPQPFMYPAWQKVKVQYKKDLENYVKSR